MSMSRACWVVTTWSKDASDFVSVTHNVVVRTNYIPKQILNLLAYPRHLTFKIWGGQVLVAAGAK